MSDDQGSLTIIPSVHYSQEHCRRVQETIREEEPDVVAVELGHQRFEQMDRGVEPDPFEFAQELPGNTGKAYLAFKAIQKTAVRFQGLDTQDVDMKAAVRTAAATETPVALIDDPIAETFSDIIDNVSLSAIPEILTRGQDIDPEDLEEVKEAKESMMGDFGGVESGDDIQPMVDHMRQVAPEITDVLIDKRDRTMAQRLHKIKENGYDAVVVIGAGHHNGILDYLDRFDAGEEYPDDVSVPIRESEMSVTDIPIN